MNLISHNLTCDVNRLCSRVCQKKQNVQQCPEESDHLHQEGSGCYRSLQPGDLQDRSNDRISSRRSVPCLQAVLVDKTLYVSGQIGFVPSTMEVMSCTLNVEDVYIKRPFQIVEGGAVAETKQALTNMGHILRWAVIILIFSCSSIVPIVLPTAPSVT